MESPTNVIGDVMFEFQGRIVDYISDYTPGKPYPRGSGNDVLAALGANGYVVVPRHLLDELLVSGEMLCGSASKLNAWTKARAAVVETVGPTTVGARCTCADIMGEHVGACEFGMTAPAIPGGPCNCRELGMTEQMLRLMRLTDEHDHRCPAAPSVPVGPTKEG